MAKPFDPRRLLKQISPPLLRLFFSRRRELAGIDWEEFKSTNGKQLTKAWQDLPDEKRKQFQVILQDVAELADERGLRIIAAEIARQAQRRVSEFTQLESRPDQALWFFLNFPADFDRVSLFARADALSNGRFAVRRGGLPIGAFEVTPGMLERLRKELRDYYWLNELRGQHCEVEHYTRPGGAEYFFTYLDDWPNKPLVFDGGKMEPRAERYAFLDVFAYCPADGSLEVMASGGREVHLALQQAFCKAAFGLDVGPADPLKPVYRLDSVLDPGFVYPTDPTDGIELARLSRVRISPLGNTRDLDHLELKFPPRVPRDRWLEIIFGQLRSHNLSPSRVVVKQASFQLVFVPDADGPKKMTFNVSIPNTCDLKSKPDEARLVGERCLKLWRILDA